MIRKLLKILLYSGVAFLLLALVAYLARNPVRDALVRGLSAVVSSSLQGSLHIGTLRGTLLTSLILQDVVVRDQHDNVIVQVDAVRLAYNPLPLLQGRLLLSRVGLMRPRLTLIQHADGSWNVSRLVPPAAPAAPAPEPHPEEPTSGLAMPFAVVVERLRIQDGTIAMQTAVLPGVQQIDGLQMRLRGRLSSQGFRVTLHQLTARALPADVELRTVRTALRSSAGTLHLDELRLQTATTLITAGGILPGGTRPASFALQMQPLDIMEIGRLLHDDTLHGRLHMTLKAVGPPEALHVRTHVQAESGHIDVQSQLNLASTPVRYSGILDIARFNLAALVRRAGVQSDLNLRLRLEGQGLSPTKMHGQAQLDIATSHVGAIVLRPSHVDVAARPQHLHVRRFDLDTSVARMTATGAVHLDDQSDLRYQLTADLSHMRSLLPTSAVGGTIQLRGDVTGTFTALSARGTLQASKLRFKDHGLQALTLTYEGTQLGTQPQVTVRLQAQQGRSGSLTIERLEGQATYDDSTRQVRFTHQVRHSSTTSGEMQGTLTLTPTGQEIVLNELVVRLAKRIWRAPKPVEVALAPGRVHIKHFRVEHADEALELSGALEGERLQDLRVAATRIDLTALRKHLQLPEPVGGRAGLSMHLTGTLAQPVLKGQLSLRSTAPNELPFERLVTTLLYNQEKTFRSRTQVRQGGRETLTLQLHLPVDMALTNLSLSQRLLDAPVTVLVGLDRPDLQAVHRWQPTLPQLAGTLKGSLDLRGTYATLTLATQMQLQRLGMPGVVDHVEAPIHLTAEVVTAESVHALGHMLTQGQLLPTLRKLEARVPRLRGQLPGRDAPPYTVEVKDLLLQADGSWSPEGLEATLHTLRLQAQALHFPRARVTLAGRVTPQQAELTTLRLRLPRSELHGRGTVAFDSQRLQLHVDLSRVQLTEFVPTFPATLPPDLQGTLDVHGTLQEPQIVTRLHYAGGRLVTELAAQLQQAVPRYGLTVRVTDLDVARVLPEAQGRLHASLRLDGTGFTGEERQARLALRVTSDQFTLLPGLTTHLDAAVQGETVQLEKLHVQSTPLTFQARGGLSAKRDVDLTYSLTLGDLHPLEPLLGVRAQAQGELTGDVQGSFTDLQMQGRVQIREWGVAAFQGQAIQADFSATHLFAEPRASLNIRLTELHGPSLLATSLTLDATLQTPRGTFTVDVTEGPYAASRLAGTVLLHAGEQLTLTQLRVQHRDLVWENDGPIEAVRNPQGGIQLHPLLLRSGEQTIRAQGRLAPEGGVAADIHVQQLHVRSTVQAVAPHADVPDGRLALDLTLQGTVAQPQLEGTMALTSIQLQQQSIGEVRSTFGVAAQTLRLDFRWQDQGAELLRAHGTLGMGPTGTLALQVQVPELNLHKLAPLSSAVQESAGTLTLDAHLAGTLAQPQVDGHLEVRDGVLRLAITGERYRDIQVRLLFRGERMDIARCHIGSRSGPFEVTGYVEHGGSTLRYAELAIRATDFTAMHTTDKEAVLSATMDLKGSLDEMTVTGKVSVPRGRLRLPEQLTGAPAGVEPWELTIEGAYGSGPAERAAADGTAPVVRKPAPLPFLRADVSLDMPRNVWVQGAGAAVELRGTLRVTKDLHAPFIVHGSIETVRGFATFYGKKFLLEQGRVTFPGTEEINPIVDVVATHTVSIYTVSIHVEGKAQQPQLTLSSQPEEEQSDIVSLLVFGKTTDRLTSSEQSALSGRAQGVAGSVVAGQLSNTVGKEFGLDVINVTSGEELGTGSASVGRYITQDIFLSYERRFAEEGGNKVGVEYSLKRNLKLKGSSSDFGETSIDLLWQIEY